MIVMFWWCLLFKTITLVISVGSPTQANIPVFEVWKSIGGRSELPCPLSPSEVEDRPVLVLWFKGGNSESIYSYDARKDDFSSGQRWQDEAVLNNRAFFTLATLPPALVIDPTEAEDQGIFTCRVEYIKSPSTFVKVNLSIIVPPDPPSIFWKDEEVMGSIGPLTEGEKAELVCITKGGRPTPTVTWWQGGHQMDSVIEGKIVHGETIILSKTVVQANRHLFRMPVVCHAHAPNPGKPLTEPRSVSAILNITLPPLTVKISGVEKVISAGTTIHPLCIAAGSHPPPEIVWRIGEKILEKTSSSFKEEGNVTTSSVTIITKRHHHGANLQCQAVNKILPESDLIDSINLNVIYKPEVKLRLGRMLNISNLVEGKDAFFECKVDANPSPHKIEWLFNGKFLEHKKGVVISGANLGLQDLKREHSGSYQCIAENLEGRTASEFVYIHIKYAPICAFDVVRTQGAAINQESKIVCKVEADPVDDVQFFWSKVLPSGREMRVPPQNFTVKDTAYQIRPNESVSSGIATSFMMVTPSHIGEFGRFICRAKTRIGTQIMPCIVSLVSAGPPEPPFNCTATPGDSSLNVSCREGFNGGFSQKFYLMAFYKDEMVSNQTSDSPSWTINGLFEGSEIKLKVKSENPKGQSDVVTFLAHMPIAHQQSVTEPERSNENYAPIWGGILGGIFTVLVLSFIVIFTLCRRKLVRKTKSEEIMSMGSSDKSAVESGPDVITSVHRRRRLSSPSVDVLEYASCAETDGALSTENTDDDSSYQLNESTSDCKYNSKERSKKVPSTSSQALILKPSSYQSSKKRLSSDDQKEEPRISEEADEKRYPNSNGSSVIPKTNGTSDERGQKLREPPMEDSYRPYERGKEDFPSLLGKDHPSNQKTKPEARSNSHTFKKKHSVQHVLEREALPGTPLPVPKKRNSVSQIKKRRNEDEDEIEHLIKDKNGLASDRIRESAV